MANTIFYFSATGNSLDAAKNIAAKLKDSSLVSMAASIDNVSDLAPDGSVGFVFPVYYFGLPKLVREFITAVDLTQASYVYIACVYGKSGGNGGCISQTRKLLKNKGKTLDSAFYIKSVDNFILWTWDVTATEKHSALHENVRKKSGHIAKIVSDRKSFFDKSIYEYVGPILFGYNRFIKTVNTDDKAFNCSDKCNSCGLCKEVCPTNNIRLSDGFPLWKSETCQRCLACLHLCPSACIQYGKITVKRHRYKNPNVSLNELKLSSIKEILTQSK
jgi:ferredoxin